MAIERDTRLLNLLVVQLIICVCVCVCVCGMRNERNSKSINMSSLMKKRGFSVDAKKKSEKFLESSRGSW